MKAGTTGMTCDVVIAGCGVAGLYAALNLPEDMRVIRLSKGDIAECDSMLAQGGVCVLPAAEDYDAFFEDTIRAGHYDRRFFEDTIRAGHYENRRESVDIMIRSSRSVINDLIALGARFEREEDGSLAFTREGAHSRPRILFHADVTGKEITETLLAAVRRLPNVTILEHVAAIDLLVDEEPCACADGSRTCRGLVAVEVTEAASSSWGRARSCSIATRRFFCPSRRRTARWRTWSRRPRSTRPAPKTATTLRSPAT